RVADGLPRRGAGPPQACIRLIGQRDTIRYSDRAERIRPEAEDMVTEDASWIPAEIDTTKANVARVYDWFLGGGHNFRVDQAAARALIALGPRGRAIARGYRAFLIRAVRYLVREAGIRQFLDIGSGIPTAKNVHQVAQETAPRSRVVYVDNDDVAV